MATMGRYCKAYSVSRLREFSGWREKTENLKKVKETINGNEVERTRLLSDDDYLFLQENLFVTDGIFIDENVVYDRVTQEWKAFCVETLKFRVPVEELGEAAAAEGGQT